MNEIKLSPEEQIQSLELDLAFERGRNKELEKTLTMIIKRINMDTNDE